MKNLLYIGDQLSKHGFTPTSIETLGPMLQSEGHALFYASSLKNPILRFLDMACMVLKKRNRVDCILIDTYSTKNFWYAVATGFLARCFNIPYIPILRGGDLPNRLTRSSKIARTLFGKAYVNIAPSRYLENAFVSFGIQNIAYIPNTIVLENYPVYPKHYDVPRLLWVRSFASLYNPTLAIDVFESVKRIYPDASLTMIGPDKDGSLERARAYAHSKNLEVVFTGRFSKKEWIAYSKQCNVFINTTNFDNTPVSVMEAMALGFPVVSTNVGGIPFLLEDTVDALLTDPDDSTAMVAAVLKLISDAPLRDRLVENARRKAQAWDWKAVKLLWKEVLK